MELKKIVSEAKAKQFIKKSLITVNDLINFLPIRYLDFRHPKPFGMAEGWCSVTGIAGRAVKSSEKNYTKMSLREPATGRWISVIWFGNSKYICKKMSEYAGKNVIVCGCVKRNESGFINIVSPLIVTDKIEQGKIIYPVYSKIQGMSDEFLKSTIREAFKYADMKEDIDRLMLKDFNIISREEKYKCLHFPESIDDVVNGKKRIVFESLYHAAYDYLDGRESMSEKNRYRITDIDKARKYVSGLPYGLTPDQKTSLNNITLRLASEKKLYSILQGDVGCGKSIIAFIASLMMAQNGYQTAIMTPLGTLSSQHAEQISEIFEGTGYKTAYLSSGLKKKEREKMLKEIEEGQISVVTGTHSLLTEDVVFKNLALVIIDEEQKFGVEQRRMLEQKGCNPNVMLMSATPIPRTQADILYGEDTELFTIKTMPKGRNPVKTCVTRDKVRAYGFIADEVSKRHQAYIVCPYVNEQDDVASVEGVFKELKGRFGNKIAYCHGGMKKEKIEEVFEKFRSNEISVLVSTTIIEVGINVPNATVIMIADADRFGLAQLHQLRGRVGRGSYQGYCILQTNDPCNERLEAMKKYNSGFDISTADAQSRNFGSLMGTEQSGNDQTTEYIRQYTDLFYSIRNYLKKEIFRFH